MKNEGKNAKHGFKIMTAVITVCAVLCTVFSAMSLVLLYKDHIMLKKYGDFVSYENSTKNEGEKDGFYLVTKEAKAEGESDTAANAETESAAASSAAGQTSASTPVGVNSQKSSGDAQPSEGTYTVNVNTKKIHSPSCSYAMRTSSENKKRSPPLSFPRISITGTASAPNAMPADSSNILFAQKYSTHRKSLSSNRIVPTASEFYA